MAPAPDARSTWRDALFRPIDNASLVLFRVVFGLMMLWQVVHFFEADLIRPLWIEPSFHFRYFGFEWVRPWPGNGMYVHFAVLGVAALGVTLGLWYRVSAAVFALGFAYMFLLEQARFLNHYYLITLVSFWMVLIPAHRACSLDAWWRPGIRSSHAPAWALWILLFHLCLAYFFGGVNKLTGDYLVHAQPVRAQLMSTVAKSGWLEGFLDQPWVAYAVSYAGVIYDLFVVPLLLWKRTRVLAFVATLLFHLTNVFLFKIGVFPWFMMAGTALFFAPSWPRDLWARWRARRSGAADGSDGVPATSAAGGVVERRDERSARSSRLAALALVAYAIVHLLLPLRHHLYPGDPSWTGEGQFFSWRMISHWKRAEIRFRIRDKATGQVERIEHGLPFWQAVRMAQYPDLALQFAHHLAARYRSEGRDVAVHARALASLNGREFQDLIDPKVDLAEQRRSLAHAEWIVPLEAEFGSVW